MANPSASRTYSCTTRRRPTIPRVGRCRSNSHAPCSAPMWCRLRQHLHPGVPNLTLVTPYRGADASTVLLSMERLLVSPAHERTSTAPKSAGASDSGRTAVPTRTKSSITGFPAPLEYDSGNSSRGSTCAGKRSLPNFQGGAGRGTPARPSSRLALRVMSRAPHRPHEGAKVRRNRMARSLSQRFIGTPGPGTLHRFLRNRGVRSIGVAVTDIEVVTGDIPISFLLGRRHLLPAAARWSPATRSTGLEGGAQEGRSKLASDLFGAPRTTSCGRTQVFDVGIPDKFVRLADLANRPIRCVGAVQPGQPSRDWNRRNISAADGRDRMASPP